MYANNGDGYSNEYHQPQNDTNFGEPKRSVPYLIGKQSPTKNKFVNIRLLVNNYHQLLDKELENTKPQLLAFNFNL